MFSYPMTTPSCATCSTAAPYLTKCPMWEFVLLAPAVDHGKVKSASTLYYIKMRN